MKKVFTRLDEPDFHVKLNLYGLIFWICMVPITIVFLRESIVFIVFMSIYALIVGHLSGWSAARAEVETQGQTESIDKTLELVKEDVGEVDEGVENVEEGVDTLKERML